MSAHLEPGVIPKRHGRSRVGVRARTHNHRGPYTVLQQSCRYTERAREAHYASHTVSECCFAWGNVNAEPNNPRPSPPLAALQFLEWRDSAPPRRFAQRELGMRHAAPTSETAADYIVRRDGRGQALSQGTHALVNACKPLQKFGTQMRLKESAFKHLLHTRRKHFPANFRGYMTSSRS